VSHPVEILLPPFAPVLLESMRAIGYSFETAIADIVDNAISAQATCVDISFSPYGSPCVSILDNGHGMAAAGLIEAMRHGSQNPLDRRDPRDLGRFGLGLKTASLSQCRKLTVATVSDGDVNAWSWDLDVIHSRQDWILVGVTEDTVRELPRGPDLLGRKSGTLVVWQNLDRIAPGTTAFEQVLESKMDAAREHLALVFHRIIAAKRGGGGVSLCINKVPVEPLDPFLLGNRATQHLPVEEFFIEHQAVTVSPFILPHISKLTRQEMAVAGGEDGLRKSQGFYIYRNERLICWGSWAKLTRQEELTKLARVRVDIPNNLDHLWTLDIKKSSAIPPESLKQNLKRIIERIVERSRTVYTYRGRKTKLDNVTHIWERASVRGGYAYQLNPDHPLVSAIRAQLPPAGAALLEDLLQLVESCFPFDLLYVDMASDSRTENRSLDEEDESSFQDALVRLSTVLRPNFADDSTLLATLCSIEPFARDRERTTRIFATAIARASE
jgi:hypothetical protein